MRMERNEPQVIFFLGKKESVLFLKVVSTESNFKNN